MESITNFRTYRAKMNKVILANLAGGSIVIPHKKSNNG